MSAPTYTYNGYQFQHPTLRVDQQVLYDEAGIAEVGTDYTFSISGFLTGTSEADLHAQINAMECRVRTPRKSFSVVFGSEVVYSFDNVGDDLHGLTLVDVVGAPGVAHLKFVR